MNRLDNIVSFDNEKLILVDSFDNEIGSMSKIDCHRGDAFRFIAEDQSNDIAELTSNYPSLGDELSEGDLVMLADGQVSMRVTRKEPGAVHCIVVQPGAIRSRQGINLPGVKLGVNAITDADHDNAIWDASFLS